MDGDTRTVEANSPATNSRGLHKQASKAIVTLRSPWANTISHYTNRIQPRVASYCRRRFWSTMQGVAALHSHL
jgi:hypothetical protein